MLSDITITDNIYIVTGYANIRNNIDSLCMIIKGQLGIEPARLFFVIYVLLHAL